MADYTHEIERLDPRESTTPVARGGKYLAAAFLVGFSSLVFEVYSARVLFLYFVESIHAVAITLSAFLAGLATSALLCARWVAHDRARAVRLLVVLMLTSAVYGLLVLPSHELIPLLVDRASALLGEGFALDLFQAALAWTYLFLPGLFVGGAFPVLSGLYVTSMDTRTAETGMVYFWDTVGAVVGSLAAAFVLLPGLGLDRALYVPAALNGVVVALLVVGRAARGAALGATAISVALAAVPPSPPLSRAALPSSPEASEPLPGPRPGGALGKIVAQEESPFGTVTVADDARGVPGDRALFIGLRDMCHATVHASEALLATNTLAHLPERARVLNVGLGCGIVAGLIAESPRVSALEIAEINPVVVQMAREHFRTANRAVLEHPRTTLFVQDGAELVRRTPRRYDAIVIDVEEPTVLHSSPLYTREYFELIRDKLAPGGILSLWVIGSDLAYGKVVWNTLGAVFPHVDARLPSDHPNFNFYASRAPLRLSPADKRSISKVRDMLALPIEDVNTLENRALERHFDIRKVFALPRSYDEAVFTDAERTPERRRAR